MKKKDYYNTQSKDTLITFLMNQEVVISQLRHKLFVLTGCKAFGDYDPMNGDCVYCHEKTPIDVERCQAFSKACKDVYMFDADPNVSYAHQWYSF